MGFTIVGQLEACKADKPSPGGHNTHAQEAAESLCKERKKEKKERKRDFLAATFTRHLFERSSFSGYPWTDLSMR